MSNVVQFSVDDSSPTISYFPFGDTLTGSPDLTAGWNPSRGGDLGLSDLASGAGSGKSLHVTSLDGAAFQVSWKGTGITLYGNATHSTYTIAVDGSTLDASSSADLANGVLASIGHLPDLEHTLRLVVHAQDTTAIVEFDRAEISAPVSPANISTSSLSDQFLDDTTDFAFHGQWSFANGSHQSTTAGDSVSIGFKGTTLVLTGSTSPLAGRYSVTLDGNLTTSYSAQSSLTDGNSILYYASGLDATVAHNVQVVNTQGSALVLQAHGAQVFGISGSGTETNSSSPVMVLSTKAESDLSSGTIAALVLAGILLFFIITLTALYFMIYRPMRRRQTQAKAVPDQETASVLVLDITRPGFLKKSFSYEDESIIEAGPSRRSGFLRWKEDVEGGLGSLGRGALGIVFRHSDSSGSRRPSAAGTLSSRGRESSSEGPKSTASSGHASKGKGRETGKWSWGREKPLPARSLVQLPPDPARESHLAPSGISSLSYLTGPISPIPAVVPPDYRASLPLAVPQPPSPPAASPGLDDRGSVRQVDADDHQSVLGDGTARIALRSLSPRTSETLDAVAPAAKPRKKRRRKDSDGLAADTPTVALRTTSPFHVDFDGGDERRKSNQSRVRFFSKQKGDSSSESQGRTRNKGRRRRLHALEASFLDFASSSDGSTMTRSIDHSSSSFSAGPASHWSIGGASSSMLPTAPPQTQTQTQGLTSRWSATTAAPSTEAAGATADSSADSFPFPVSMPGSPEGQRLSSLNAHPYGLGSDDVTSLADSLPVSISEICFRPGHASSSVGHPPLPEAPQPPGSSFIVQRVLGASFLPSASSAPNRI
ncbi:unnamed protein product [Mycena citricolor]|uniref:Transmembrane protein n=1 Tax=Mycena citricolor TaxID=2018698 RepID=A0AAD2GXC3_9AGAR|nr:unnamed protein product [Mycena citricolor]